MAMTGSDLGAVLAQAVGVTDPVAVASFVSLATALVSYIQTHAAVSVTTSTNVTTPQLATVISSAPGSPVTGVITGAVGSGTGIIS